ncbi:MAG: hypothetical protein FRX49_01411 [Trebouxia sp. A1-2]|nr:MAG: hypothetical protein FRX49_01411 [Trebouxia sp. A1-2]
MTLIQSMGVYKDPTAFSTEPKAKGLLQAQTCQHSTAQHGTARHGTAQCGTAQHGIALHTAAWYSMVQCKGRPARGRASAEPMMTKDELAYWKHHSRRKQCAVWKTLDSLQEMNNLAVLERRKVTFLEQNQLMLHGALLAHQPQHMTHLHPSLTSALTPSVSVYPSLIPGPPLLTPLNPASTPWDPHLRREGSARGGQGGGGGGHAGGHARRHTRGMQEGMQEGTPYGMQGRMQEETQDADGTANPMTVPIMSPHISNPRLGQASRATIWDPRPTGPLISASSLACPAAATCPGAPDPEEAEEGEETGEGKPVAAKAVGGSKAPACLDWISAAALLTAAREGAVDEAGKGAAMTRASAPAAASGSAAQFTAAASGTAAAGMGSGGRLKASEACAARGCSDGVPHTATQFDC